MHKMNKLVMVFIVHVIPLFVHVTKHYEVMQFSMV